MKPTKIFPPLEQVTKPLLSTNEIAHYSNKEPQTWRAHACYGTGGIKPIRVGGRLGWPTAAAKKLLGVAA